MRPKIKFVHFSEMAKKWNYSEDEIIQLAIQNEFNLYCFNALPSIGRPLRFPFYISVGDLYGFLPGKVSITCRQFLFKTSDFEEDTIIDVTPEERLSGKLSSMGELESNSQTVKVSRSDLFLHIDEIEEMEMRYPGCNQGARVPEKSHKQVAPTTTKQQLHPRRRERSSSFLPDMPENQLQNEIDQEVVSVPASEMSLESNVKSQSSSSKSNPPQTQSAKVQKASDQESDFKRDQSVKHDVKEKARLPDQTMVSKTGYLRLENIIGNKKKDIPPIIPVSKSSWYEGIKKGKYPEPVKLGARSVAWRASDIWMLKEKIESGDWK